jgi:hypothetical protein
MTTMSRPTDNVPTIDWEEIVTRPAPEREDALGRFYAALATLPKSDRLERLRTIVATTYRLPDDEFRTLTESRLRAWLGLDEGVAATVAQSYDAVLQEVSANDAMRRVAVVQTLARDFSLEDQERLRALVPAVFADQGSSLAATMAGPAQPGGARPRPHAHRARLLRRSAGRRVLMASGARRRIAPPRAGLKEPPDRLAAGARIVVRLEHLEFVALDQVLAREELGRDLAVLDQPAQALRMDAEHPRRLDEVQEVVKRIVIHALVLWPSADSAGRDYRSSISG